MGQKTYYKFDTKEERLQYWKQARIDYTKWRRTSEAREVIRRKSLKQQGLCFWCMKPLTELIHVDHIFPLYLGGSNDPLNLCITHPTCNMDKGAKVYTTYKQSCKRRRQFKLMLKAKRAKEILKNKPNANLSKKNKKAINLVDKMRPY